MNVSHDQPRLDSRTKERPSSSFGLAVNRRAASEERARQEIDLEGINLAVRMLSETAHDLRSPLTTIRESVRLVHDGDLGDVNEEQQILLMAAINEVDRVNQMIGDMTQLERLRSGVPRTRREWVSIQTLREDIEQTLRPWAVPRGISVLWDGADSPNMTVFADKVMMRRLIVNLVANAIRASDEGGTVLVKLEPQRGGETISWTVIDQGQGIPEAELVQIAARHVSLSGGEGIGLAISRQLAALHFSNLSIRSRSGVGTEVSFETAAAGPHSVAQAWTRWRTQAGQPKHRPKSRSENLPGKTAGTRDVNVGAHQEIQRTLRLDPPVLSVSLRAETPQPRCAQRLAAGIVTLGAATDRVHADRFDAVLQNQLRMFELAYRVDVRRWVWILDADTQDVDDRIRSITEMCEQHEPELRTTWGEPQIIPVDEQRLAPRMSDLLIRHSLNQLGSTYSDGNEVRLGTAPLEPSPIAANRLDDEMRRLGERWKKQSNMLFAQAEKLRPKS